MSSIWFDKFSSGLDLRKSEYTAGADSFRDLENAYVTTGHEIKKRPCAAEHAALEAGSVGMKGALGVLNTFHVTYGAVSHADTRFVSRLVPHPTVTTDIRKIHRCDVFNGYLYVVVEYQNGDVRHHYLDAGSTGATPKWVSPAWAANTAYATTSPHFVTPTVPNGFRYECTTGGTSHATTEPTWPTTLGATVVDGTVTWTCRTFVIVDTNCPQSKSIAKVKSKIYAIDGQTVPFCAAANARDWTTASDAGFLATGINQTGKSEALAVAEFKDKIAVFFADGIQVWNADPDPDLTVLVDKVFNSGCRFPGGIGQVSQDTFFLSDQGFRSVQLAVQSQELEDNDVGSPIDELVRPMISDDLDPLTEWLSNVGQLVCVFDDTAWTFTFSRTSKVNAWGEYRFPFQPDDMTTLSGVLYLRDGDTVYRLDENTHQDGATPPRVRIEFPLLDFKAPGVLKLIQGCDFVGRGSAEISFKYQTTDEDGNLVDHETDPVTLTNNSIPGVMTPVELCVTAIAPVITHEANEAFRLSRLMFYYEMLGAL